MSLSDSQTFRIQMDTNNFGDLEDEIFNDHLKSPFNNGDKLTSPKDPFDMEWNFESNLTSPKSFEDSSPKSPLSDYDSYFLDDKAGLSPFQSPASSEESSFNSPFESFLDSELEFSDLKMFEGNKTNQPQITPKIEGIESQKMTPQHLNHQQSNMPINNNLFLNRNNMNAPNNQPFNNTIINPNNNNNKTVVNNTNNNLFINPQHQQQPLNLNIPIIQNPPINIKKAPTQPINPNTKSSTNGKANDEKSEPTNKKRKRVLNPNTINNTNVESKDNTTTPNSKYKYLLTEDKVMTTTSEEIDMYIEHLTKNNLVSSEELKELKKQRRRIKNREYAKSKRDLNKGKVGDLHSRIEELENENKMLKEHLRNVLHQFEIFKQQVSLTNSGNNKITFNPPNLPSHPGQKPRPFNNNKSNTLFVFVILFSLGIYFNIFAGLGPVFSSSNKSGTSRMMLFFNENYYPLVEWIKSFFVTSSRRTLAYHPYYDWERPAKHFRQNLITDASYVERNDTHIISYLAVQDKSRCFYENKYNWIKREQKQQ